MTSVKFKTLKPVGCGCAHEVEMNLHCPKPRTDENPAYFLNSYRPLGATRKGRKIAEEIRSPRFVDNSIRHEPDFQHQFPAITGLCRPHKLVDRVRIGDRIAYVTTKYLGRRHLVAILEVIHVARSHQDAAQWYRRYAGGKLPRNCVVPKKSGSARGTCSLSEQGNDLPRVG